MKKQLFDLTIEEFTCVLLDFQKKIHLSINIYDEDSRQKIDEKTGTFQKETLIGSYDDLDDYSRSYGQDHPLRKAMKEFLETQFDYDIQINNLDIYNYLEHLTDNFQEEKVNIVLHEMDCFYLMEYLEEIDEEVQNKYIEEGWKFPTKEIKLPNLKNIQGEEIHLISDLGTMREKVYPCRSFTYHLAISLLKRKINSNETLSNIHLSDSDKGNLVDYLRIIDAMYEYGFFVTSTGKKALKKDVFKAFGNIVNKEFRNPSDNLGKGRKSQNGDGNSQLGTIFERLKEISISKTKK